MSDETRKLGPLVEGTVIERRFTRGDGFTLEELSHEDGRVERWIDGAPVDVIRCSKCGASVSTFVPAGTVVRAFLECPECIRTTRAPEDPFGPMVADMARRAEIDAGEAEPEPTPDPSPAVLAHMRKADRLLRRLADIVTDSEELVDQPDARRALDDIDRHLERGRKL